jgi:multiple antibiotic resistance protein
VASQIEALLRLTALAIAGLLPIVNPPGCAPVFLSMTPGASDATRTLLARRVAVNGSLLLVGAMLIGSHVLGFFGLSLPVVKIAGGLLVIATGWRLVNSEGTSESASMAPGVKWAADEITRRSFYPLTFPLTVGPGSLSVALTLGAGAGGSQVPLWLGVSGEVLGIAVVGVTIYLCYRFAGNVMAMLGATGTAVLLRMSAFILLAVGVEILCNGLGERFALFTSRP